MSIKKVLQSNVPVKIWTDDVEPEAIEQLMNTASLPIVYKHVAVMPDVHFGLGATIGSVVATRKALIPAAVGVDIGCGMMAIKTDLSPVAVEGNLKAIRKKIESMVPVGFMDNPRQTEQVDHWAGWKTWDEMSHVTDELKTKAYKQLGSLGGGNHFIEVCLDEENPPNVWVMLHSGSRGTGNILARRHIENARDIAKLYQIPLPNKDLAYLAENTPEFDAYTKDLMWLQNYALENREEMMRRVVAALAEVVNQGNHFGITTTVNCHHNYAAVEHHFGKNVWITRKGAVRARKGDLGIIPGSMGARSFIVEGLGNPDSFNSCSHGAGRKMSRTSAKKNFSVADLIAQTEGVECRKDDGVLDEIPGAYKDIDEVMANQADLVTVKAALRQIVCVKG